MEKGFIVTKHSPVDVVVRGVVREIESAPTSADASPQEMLETVTALCTQFVLQEVQASPLDDVLSTATLGLAPYLFRTVDHSLAERPSAYESVFLGVEFKSAALSTTPAAARVLGHFLMAMIDDVVGELCDRGWVVARPPAGEHRFSVLR